jgi:hypothetical protein
MTASPDAPAAAAQWQEFATRPARYADAKRIAACFDNRFGVDLCERLKTCRRLEVRLSEVVLAHYRLATWIPTDACDAADRAIALASAAQLTEMVQRCGVIYCSSVIADVILVSRFQQIGCAILRRAAG